MLCSFVILRLRLKAKSRKSLYFPCDCLFCFLFLFCINPLLFGCTQQIDIYASAILNILVSKLPLLQQKTRPPHLWRIRQILQTDNWNFSLTIVAIISIIGLRIISLNIVCFTFKFQMCKIKQTFIIFPTQLWMLIG